MNNNTNTNIDNKSNVEPSDSSAKIPVMNTTTREELLRELEKITDKITTKRKWFADVRMSAQGDQNCNSLSDERKAELKEEHQVIEIFHSIEMKALMTKRDCIKAMIVRNSSDVWDIV